MSTKITTALGLALALALPAVGALASGNDTLPEDTRAKVKAELESQGYEVRKIEAEDGMIEAYAIKDGVRMEVYLDKDLKILRTKIDD